VLRSFIVAWAVCRVGYTISFIGRIDYFLEFSLILQAKTYFLAVVSAISGFFIRYREGITDIPIDSIGNRDRTATAISIVGSLGFETRV
jgi:hypothetical protein